MKIQLKKDCYTDFGLRHQIAIRCLSLGEIFTGAVSPVPCGAEFVVLSTTNAVYSSKRVRLKTAVCGRSLSQVACYSNVIFASSMILAQRKRSSAAYLVKASDESPIVVAPLLKNSSLN